MLAELALLLVRGGACNRISRRARPGGDDRRLAGLSDGIAPAAICGRSTDAEACGPASSRHSSCTLRAF